MYKNIEISTHAAGADFFEKSIDPHVVSWFIVKLPRKERISAMMTVHEVSKISGVSIRALHHYDHIGLLPATEVTEAGYRLYDETAMERLQRILLFKELEFSLKDIKEILDSPDFDRNKALEQQIHLLELRKEHLQNLIDFARGIKAMGVKSMSFGVFDTKKIDEYAAQAKASWGKTDAYREYERKSQSRSREEQQKLNVEMMNIFAEFGGIKELEPDSAEAVALAKKLQDHITENYYTCTDEILLELGIMYAGGGDFTTNIDEVGGEGTAVFVCEAIKAMTAKR